MDIILLFYSAVVILLLAILVTGLTLVFQSAFRKKWRPTSSPPVPLYQSAASILTPNEAQFYHCLVDATGTKATVQCKVRLGDVLRAPENDLAAFRLISQKHLDFVLCDVSSLRPLVAVELDDGGQTRPSVQTHDAFVDKACASAGLPILHIGTQTKYDADDFRAVLLPHLVS